MRRQPPIYTRTDTLFPSTPLFLSVLEFNVRMGDPETQPILFRLDSDLLDLLEAAVDGQLDRVQTQWNPQPSLGVVMAAGGYPGAIRKGDVIRGLEADLGMAKVFHAGRSEEHTSELQSLMRISYAVFCLKKKKKHTIGQHSS